MTKSTNNSVKNNSINTKMNSQSPYILSQLELTDQCSYRLRPRSNEEPIPSVDPKKADGNGSMSNVARPRTGGRKPPPPWTVPRHAPPPSWWWPLSPASCHGWLLPPMDMTSRIASLSMSPGCIMRSSRLRHHHLHRRCRKLSLHERFTASRSQGKKPAHD